MVRFKIKAQSFLWRCLMKRLQVQLSAIQYSAKEVRDDILLLDLMDVTACMVGFPENTVDGWVLVDTGPEAAADFIIEHAKERFWRQKPKAIILTHGHVKHAGAAGKLADSWNVPVYMHPLEMPYLIALADYPRPDSRETDRLEQKMDPYPQKGINLSFHSVPLPLDRTVPGMRGWQWVQTPGHTVGHISLFRPQDGTLIAGDAFTQKQEALFGALSLHPDAGDHFEYTTADWSASLHTFERLRDLKASLAILSHGKPLPGEELEKQLDMLLNHHAELIASEQQIGPEV
jgi:glyoxylase-like metal-dependent hydrolase (beta-lactamase superfamily II)